MDESSLHWRHQLASSLLLALAISALCQPGLLIGAAIAATTFAWRGISPWLRWVAALAMAGLALHLLSYAVWAWPERLAGTSAVAWWPAGWSFHPSVASISKTLVDEALAGPLWVLAFLWEEKVRTGRLSHAVMRDTKEKRAIQRAFASHIPPNGGVLAMTHSDGALTLGIESTSHKAFDLTLPATLGRHVTVLGRPGSGKTTTALRLMQGALAAGYPVVVVDAKGLGSLRRNAEAISAALPFQVVAPGDPRTLRYNPCAGTPSQVSNKLVGAFAFGPEAEIYKNIVQETLPIVVRALLVTQQPVTLANISEALDPKSMLGFAAQVGDKDDAAKQLLVSFANRGSLYNSAFAGMRARLGALMHGEFGEVFASDGPNSVLDLAGAFTKAGITYISLPAMASSEDVGLMARVLVQDIKQVAAARLRNDATIPALLVLDEFAALQEANQLNDLLLQAREAGIACVVCTQFLPPASEAPLLRAALMGAGLFIAHQTGAEDAEPVAKLFGTEARLDWTAQIDNQTGYSEKGTVRPVHEYVVHPDTLRNLPRGKAAVRSDVDTLRIASVDIALPAASTNGEFAVQHPTPPAAQSPATALPGTAETGTPTSFIGAFARATLGDGLLLWAVALLIGWEGFFQWALAALYGGFTATLFLEVQLGAHAYLGLSGGGAILAVIVTAVLGVGGGAIAGVVAFPFLAVVWIIQNFQAGILWAGFGFAVALAVVYSMYLTERSAGIPGYRQLSSAERDLVLPIYSEVASELDVHDPPRLLIADSPMPGAGAHLATITLTTALLMRPQSEIAAVLAHELGHHMHGHALRLRLAWAAALPIVVLYGIGFALTDTKPGQAQLPRTPLGVDPVQFHQQLLSAGVSSARSVVALAPRLIGDVAYFVAWPAMHLMLLPFVAAASRRMELEADAVVARIGGAEHLVSHLRLSEFADWTHGGWEAFSVKTHPPVAVRIDHLSGKPRRSTLDPLTHTLDRLTPFGLSVRELVIWGVFLPSVLVVAGYWLSNLWRLHS
ncbi:MAG TPA: M48 family metalloprotease [Candidatus Baltobacterales bacterium]|nr:M48 family metalloprotease [Candidatus Baltobacterales bacterium]